MITLLLTLTTAALPPAPRPAPPRLVAVARARIMKGTRISAAMPASPTPDVVIRNGLVEFR